MKNNQSELHADSCFTLSNGVKIPVIGYGTWKVDGQSARDCVCDAIACGYCLIDTAAMYGNEKEVGEALHNCSVPREDLFITSKCPPEARSYDEVTAACEKTLQDLQLDHLDLYLIHWPANAKMHPDTWHDLNRESWKAMIDLYRSGKVRAIGVSNFLIDQLDDLMDASVRPMVNQIEYHPGWIQPETVKYCQDHDILVEAWSPLGRTRVLELPELLQIADEVDHSTAQVCLRFALQNGVLPLPKSVHPERMKANLDVFDFSLSPEQMNEIDSLEPAGFSGHDPHTEHFG